jgi:DNA-binding transcriptional ArsR family regulator
MDIFSAIADPKRRNILELIAKNGELTASDISSNFNITPPAISQHLQVLLATNLVTVEKKAQQRIYRVNTQSLLELESWIQRLTKIWDKRFERLDRILEIKKQKLARRN